MVLSISDIHCALTIPSKKTRHQTINNSELVGLRRFYSFVFKVLLIVNFYDFVRQNKLTTC